jgi:PAS domain-containing protein
MAGFDALGADRSGSAGFVVGGAAIPASGSVLGADHDFGDYAVLTGRGARGFVAAFCGNCFERGQPLDLRTVVDAIPAPVVSALPDGCVEFVNPGWREYAGRSLELTGSGWQAVIHPADISKFVTKGAHSRHQRRPPHGPPATDERS